MTAPTLDQVEAPGDNVEPSLADPARRGGLTIADRVVEKVAAQAVTEVDRATGTPRTVLGQALGRATEDSPARTSALVDGDLVTVTVSMSVHWPAPVREVTAQVRRRVVERVQELTGLQVVEVDIDVPTLLTKRNPTPRVR